MDPRRRLSPVPLQSGLAHDLTAPEMVEERMMQSFHIVCKSSDAETEIHSAGDGLIELLRFLPILASLYPVARKSRKAAQFMCWIYLQSTRVRSGSDSCGLKYANYP